MLLDQRRRQLRSLYGFDFPEDLFRFWEFACRWRPLDPLAGIAEAAGVHLVGPFEVLAGRFDERTPRFSQYLHWRYYSDPPEFFTVLGGGEDPRHWGYYLDDPAVGEGCIAEYDRDKDSEMCPDSDNLFETLRMQLEERYADCVFSRSEEWWRGDEHEATLEAIDALRTLLMRYATGDRPETGDEYFFRYIAPFSARPRRQRRVVAKTRDGMGIVVPMFKYWPLPVKDRKLWARLRQDDNPRDLVDEAMQRLRKGFPGTALKLGKDLWAFGGEHQTMYAYDLLDAAYEALGRDILRRVLAAHREHRDLPTVDILQAEAQEEGGQE
jgi:hypothetical protein